MRNRFLCVLIVAALCSFCYTSATIRQDLTVREAPVVVPNLDRALESGLHRTVTVTNESESARLTEVRIDEPSKKGVSGQVIANQDDFISIDARAQLLKQLEHSNAAMVRNSDGTITAAFRPVVNTMNRNAQVELACSYIWGATIFSGDVNAGPYVPSIGRTAANGDLVNFAYFDISLLPDIATIISATVDYSIENVFGIGGTLYFDINDLWQDPVTATNQQIYDDVRNIGGGTTYAAETAGRSTDGTVNYALSAQAAADIATVIANNDFLFGLGFDPQISAPPPDVAWLAAHVAAWNLGTDPVLYVTYQAAGNPPAIQSVTATPASQDNIGTGIIAFEAIWTDADDLDISEYGMIFQYRTPWNETVQLSGGLWEKTGVGSYRWYGEWEPQSNHQIGPHDVRFLITDFVFTDEWGFDVNADLFTITTPAIEYADFNDTGPISVWPVGWTANPATDPGPPRISWQYDWTYGPPGSQNFIALVYADQAPQNCTLTSPVVDLSGAAVAHVFFDCYYEGTPTAFRIQGSVNGFATVAEEVNIPTYFAAGTYLPLNWNITDWAAGESNVQIRFLYQSPQNAANLAFADVIQFVASDAPVEIMDTSVFPATNDVILDDTITFSVNFTADSAASVDDFVFNLYIRSAVGLPTTLLTGLSNGDMWGSTIVQNSPGNFTASIGGLSFLPGIEIGLYDLQSYVSDGISWDYHTFDENPGELTITTQSFWYQDFNATGASGPAGWSIASAPGSSGPTWGYDQWVVGGTPINDWFAYIIYDTGGGTQSEWIQTGPINCSGRENLVFYYAYEWASGFDPGATGAVRISNNGGSSWTTIYTHTAPNPPAIETGLREFDISAFADNQSDVRLQFKYDAADDYYWIIEILQIHEDEEYIPPPIPATGPVGLGLLLAALTGLLLKRRK